MRTRPVIGALAVTLLAVSCASGGGSRASSPPSSVFIWGTTSPIDSLNPFVAVQQNSYYTFEHIYPFLVEYGPGLQIVPDFARSWTITGRGQVITFTTRAGARWSDGKPLTAADAAWTINTVIKYKAGPTASAAGAVAGISGATAPGPTTLVIRYATPAADPLIALQAMPVLPEHVWAKLASGKGTGLRTFANNAPVVSGGPFVLVKYTPSVSALFKPNPYWWGQRPLLRGFGIQFFSAADALILALKNHQIDGTEGEPLPPTTIAAVRGAGFRIAQTLSFGLRDFIINSNPTKRQNRELLDPRVRLALAHAINRAQIVSTAWLGNALEGSSVVSPAYGRWNDPKLRPESFNLALASQILNRAGYRMGPGGLRMAGGHPMSYTLLFVSDEHGPGDRAFSIIRADFRKIGIQLSERPLDATAATSAIVGSSATYQGWDLAMWDWSILPANPQFILAALTCSQWGGWNDSGYCSKPYDALSARLAADPNPASRLRIADQMQQQIYSARPYLVLTYDKWTEARAPGWAGFVLSPDGSFNQLSTQTMLQLHRTR